LLLDIKRLGRSELLEFLVLVGITAAASGCASQSPQQSPPSPLEQSSPSSPSASPASSDKGSAGTVTIRVSGGAIGATEIPFSGSYGTVSRGWTLVEGTTPVKYEVEVKSGYAQPDIVTADIQKQAEDNTTLTVQIVSEGIIEQEQSTKEPFGVVSVKYNPSEGQAR
jgi:hypothetical protein